MLLDGHTGLGCEDGKRRFDCGSLLVGLSQELLPVLDGTAEVLEMDQVEFLLECPLALCVVNFEREVWRDPMIIRYSSGSVFRKSLTMLAG